MSGSKLSNFLKERKSSYLDAVKEGKGGEWTVVMGNEAGGKWASIQFFALQPKIHLPLGKTTVPDESVTMSYAYTDSLRDIHV